MNRYAAVADDDGTWRITDDGFTVDRGFPDREAVLTAFTAYMADLRQELGKARAELNRARAVLDDEQEAYRQALRFLESLKKGASV
jgi:hypothetical protein